jgi:hypothetical protein
MYVYIVKSVCTGRYPCRHNQMHTQIRMYVQEQIHTQTRMYIHRQIHKQTRLYIHRQIHTQTRMYVHVYTWTDTHTNTHVYMPVDMDRYTCTYTHLSETLLLHTHGICKHAARRTVCMCTYTSCARTWCMCDCVYMIPMHIHTSIREVASVMHSRLWCTHDCDALTTVLHSWLCCTHDCVALTTVLHSRLCCTHDCDALTTVMHSRPPRSVAVWCSVMRCDVVCVSCGALLCVAVWCGAV